MIMKNHKSAATKEAESFLTAFPRACEIVVNVLGDKPFHLRGRLNASALDAIMSVVIANLQKLPKDLQTRYDNLKKDEEFQHTTAFNTSDVAVVKRRFELTASYLLSA